MTGPVQAKPPLNLPLSRAERRAQKKAEYNSSLVTQVSMQSFAEVFPLKTMPLDVLELIGRFAEFSGNYTTQDVYPDLFPAYSNLQDQALLKRTFSQKHQTQKHLYAAKSVIDLTFHVRRQDTVGTGAVVDGLHSIYPEVYVYAMEVLKISGKTVLGLGAARGYDLLLLGFSNAASIYANDQSEAEIELFKSSSAKLPPDVRQKMIPIVGDCTNKSTFKAIGPNQVNLIVCMNLLHFLNPPQTKNLFKNVNYLLKPGGIGIFITNGNSSVPPLNPHAICFEAVSCDFYDLHLQNRHNFWKEIDNRVDQVYKCTTEDFYLYRRERGSEWKENSSSMVRLDVDLQTRVKSLMQQERIQKIPTGQIIIRKIPIQIFNKKTLATLFINQGLEIVTVFHTGVYGHVERDERSSNAKQIGVVCRKPSKKN